MPRSQQAAIYVSSEHRTTHATWRRWVLAMYGAIGLITISTAAALHLL